MQTANETLTEFKPDKSVLNAATPEVMKHLDGLFQLSPVLKYLKGRA